MSEPTYIYEIRDNSDDEIYHTCGYFLTLEDAVDAFNRIPDDDPTSITHGCPDEHFQLDILKHETGFHGHTKKILHREWHKEWTDDESDEGAWSRGETTSWCGHGRTEGETLCPDFHTEN